jgi:hypothetical protein
MQLSAETSRGIEYLKGIVESGRTLRLSDPVRLNESNAYVLAIVGFGKQWDICLTREQLDDLPGTKEYRDSALALTRALDLRFRNLDPNLFMTYSGRLLKIVPRWPL